MRILDKIRQTSIEWWACRRGRVTASAMDKVLTARNAEPSKQQDVYIRQLIEDVRFQGPNYFSASLTKPPNTAIEDGIKREPDARRYLEFLLDCEIKQVGFIVHDNGVIGGSPDGLPILGTGEMEGCEIKCPQEKTQKRYLLDPGSLLLEYKQQIHGSMIVSGFPRWHLLSYCPPLDPVYMVVERDRYTDRLMDELVAFTGRYDETMRTLLGYGLPEMIARLHPTDAYADVA